MKKLLLALVAASCTLAFAETTVIETSKDTQNNSSKDVSSKAEAVHNFDQNHMRCGNRTLTNGSKVTGCKIQPKETNDDQHTVRFIDDNSGKHVKCEVNKKGSLVLAQCTSTD